MMVELITLALVLKQTEHQSGNIFDYSGSRQQINNRNRDCLRKVKPVIDSNETKQNGHCIKGNK